LKVGVTKNRTYQRGLSRAPYAQVWRGVRAFDFPRKNEFGIGGELEMQLKITIGLQSHFHMKVGLDLETFSTVGIAKTVLPKPSLYLCKFGRITRPIFSKSGDVRTPRSPWLRQCVSHRHLGRCERDIHWSSMFSV